MADRSCRCCGPTTTRPQMTKRHGTPREFRDALASAPITAEEESAAYQRYVSEWLAAPRGDKP